MANGQTITDNGMKIVLNRTFKETPDYTAPTQFKTGTGTTTPAVGDTDVETELTSGKDFVSSYPTLDETNFQATIRGILNTTEGNGSSITEWGTFNEDGTPLMFSHTVFTAISKTSSVQITFIQKDKFVS